MSESAGPSVKQNMPIIATSRSDERFALQCDTRVYSRNFLISSVRLGRACLSHGGGQNICPALASPGILYLTTSSAEQCAKHPA